MTWRAVVSALDEHASVRSRVSVYLHPLGGRPILWHVVRALLETHPRPDEIVVVHLPGAAALVDLDGMSAVRFEAVDVGHELEALRRTLSRSATTVLVDGAAPLLTPGTLTRLLRAAADGVAALQGSVDFGDDRVAVAGEGAALASSHDPRAQTGAVRVAPAESAELLRVADRRSLGEAGIVLRDRLVQQHQENGVSFLLPDTTWLDVDVRIGADTVVYPACVLEGTTEIGAECVIGPYSRVIDAVVGRGVELRGWNYVCRTHVRNRAVLEPFARRGGE
jgi:bifunctional N-acetylglucosamine-1-phosphate-uridyltransferase/glucosamine-1-phosphate-acetyltransferase GlmU-like protein